MQNGAIANDRVTLQKSAGSKFTVSPTIAAFNQLVMNDEGNIGVVATPCQALALAKMKLVKEDAAKNRSTEIGCWFVTAAGHYRRKNIQSCCSKKILIWNRSPEWMFQQGKMFWNSILVMINIRSL